MHINEINNVNISEVGHDVNHPTPKKFLTEVFENLGYKVHYSREPIKNAINFIFEGWSYYKLDELNKFFKKEDGYFYGILFTEFLSGCDELDPKFFTLNNFFIDEKNKLIWNKFLLFFLHYLTNIKRYIFFLYRFLTKLENKTRYIKFITFVPKIVSKKFCESLYFANPKIKNNTFNNYFYWGSMFKEIYNLTFKRFEYFDLAISVGLNENYTHLINKNIIKKYHFVPFFVSDKNNIQNFKEKKEYDLMFTGRITNRRMIILDKLKEKFIHNNFFISEILEDENEWRTIQSKSKYILSLDQYENQKFVSVAKIYEGLIVGTPSLVENNSKFIPDYMKSFCFTFRSDNFLDEIENYIKNYNKFFNIFLEMRDSFFNTFSNVEKAKLVTFLKKL